VFIGYRTDNKIISAGRFHHSCAKHVGLRLSANYHRLSSPDTIGRNNTFIIGYAMYEGYLPHNRNAVRGISIFIGGFIFNELLLLVEGLGAITYTAIPYVNELLLFAAIVMFGGLLILNVAAKKYAAKTA